MESRVKTKFKFGDIVCYVTDRENEPMIIIGLLINPDGSYVYKISDYERIVFVNEIEIKLCRGE